MIKKLIREDDDFELFDDSKIQSILKELFNYSNVRKRNSVVMISKYINGIRAPDLYFEFNLDNHEIYLEGYEVKEENNGMVELVPEESKEE